MGAPPVGGGPYGKLELAGPKAYRRSSTSNVYPSPHLSPHLSIHEIVTRASSGDLPAWAVAGDSRRAHMGRVSTLLGAWAYQLELSKEDRVRWEAVGFLHDALRDAAPEALRRRLPPTLADLPDTIIHGPAAAEQLRIDGVKDGELLRAISGHTVGDPDFGLMGRALYCADFLEPGRSFLTEWRENQRARMPSELNAVAREIAGARIGNVVEREGTILPRTVAFWNRLVEDAP